VDEQFFDQ
jgi:palmitoyltransferase ZDHHC13/17